MCFAVTGMSGFGATVIKGAGATFPAPLYERWFQEYNKLHPDVEVNYQGIGSGAGIKQFTDETVDFGASDAAMTDEQMEKVKGGVVLLPMTAGSIVLAYNLPGVEGLKLSREAYAGIFLGKIAKWNDEAIAKDNPGLKLPDLPITVAYRSDGSGTTFVFTQHLCAISPEFKEKIGKAAPQVTWPVGVGGKGNDGVTALVKQTEGTIGYVEYGYAFLNHLSFAELQNKSGNFIKATPESGASTLASVKFPANLRIWPEDPTGAQDYPIATFTWMLIYKKVHSKEKWNDLKNVILWGLTDGQKLSNEMGYIPLPPAVVAKVKAALATVK